MDKMKILYFNKKHSQIAHFPSSHHIKLTFFVIVMFRFCFRMLAVILVSLFV